MLSYDEATHCIWWGNNYYLMVGPSPVPWCIRGLPQAEPHDATTLVKKDEQPEMLPQMDYHQYQPAMPCAFGGAFLIHTLFCPIEE